SWPGLLFGSEFQSDAFVSSLFCMVCWLPGTEAGPELQVQADFDDVDGFLEAGIGGGDDRPASGRGTHEGGRIVVVELVVVPLHEAGEPVREGVLAADTGGAGGRAVVRA